MTQSLKRRKMRLLLICIILTGTFDKSLGNPIEKNPKVILVSYDEYYNEKKMTDSENVLKYIDRVVFLSKPDAKIRYYMDYKTNQNVSIIKYEENLYKQITSFDSLLKPTFENKKETILGYDCEYAWFSSFSNKIEVWFTEETEAKGSPYRKYLPNNNSLVLKIVINGNHTLIASSIENVTNIDLPDYPIDKSKEITQAEFEELKIKSRYTILPIFNKETVNFDNELKIPEANELQTDQTYRLSKGSVIMKKIMLDPEINEGGRVYAKLTCWSDGDAYDRTGSVFIIPDSTKKITMLNAFLEGLDKVPVYKDNVGNEYQGITSNQNYDPPIEIMRFFTSFGAGHFNTLREINNYPWQDSVVYKQEISSLIPNDKKKIWIGVFIGNYVKNGHKVSLELNFHPPFEKKEQPVKWIQPLFSTVNVMEMSGQNYGKLFKNDTLEVQVEIPENIKNLNLLYTSTGHGGWGNGDEFNPRMNQIFIDGQQIFSIVPWRTDCATYRLFNPASGNFSNGISSSDLSRSNWCPATLTPPYFIPLELKKGKHSLKVVIDQGEDEGGSFSHWGVTGVLTGAIISKNKEGSSTK